MRILVISPQLPVPPHAGGAIRTMYMLRTLSETDEVDLLSFRPAHLSAEDRQTLKSCCRRAFFAERRRASKCAQAPGLLKNVLAGVPFNTKYEDSPDMRAMVRKLSAEEHYDVICFEHTPSAVLWQHLAPDHGARTILTLHNIEAVQARRMYERATRPMEKCRLLLTWWPMRRWEPRMARCFDRVVVVSNDERRLLQSTCPELLPMVVPNGVDTRACTPQPFTGSRRKILMVGSLDYEPNADAVLSFHRAIWPRIVADMPDAELVIVGRHPPPEVLQLTRHPSVSVYADVPDVKPFYRDALAAVVAVRSGGGTRLKILEALALGIPVVSTPLGCEGLHVMHNRDILIAKTDEAFASLVVNLALDEERWLRLARFGRECVEREYDWQKIFSDMRHKLIVDM